MNDVLKTARRVLTIEAEGISRLKKRLNSGFTRAVEIIYQSPGKVIATGIGKSGIVARKIMATLSSTGTTSVFMHPVEALHGDLGMVAPGDVVLAVSNSGETDELVELIPALRENGAKIIALTGGLKSSLARTADAVMDCGVEREACPLGLAPTASTTAALAMGDALAVVLLEKHRFNAEDFRRRHPGGRLGDRLSLRVSEVMIAGKSVPTMRPGDSTAMAVDIIDKGDLGTVLVTARGILKGIFTDGDIRRAVLAGVDMARTPVRDLMSSNPHSIGPEALAADALHIMEEKQITALAIVDKKTKVLGILHLHDLLGRGQVSFKGLSAPSGPARGTA